MSLRQCVNLGQQAEIRLMDKLMRKANTAYPRISPYRVSHLAANKGLPPRYISWIDRIGAMVDDMRARTSGKPILEIISDSVKFIKGERLGDCAESSSLMMSSLIANGYKDGKIARLIFEAEARYLATNKVVGTQVFDTTHEFVVRNVAKNAVSENPNTYGKNLIVLDAWEGFCGNLQEAFKRYYDTFWGGMREWINTDANLKITYKPKFHICDLGKEIDAKDVEKFATDFPELIVK